MRDAWMSRMMHLCFDTFDMQIAGLLMRFNMTIDRLLLDGLHTTHAQMANGQITVPISGQGTVVMNIHQVRVGVVAQMTTLPGGFLNMTNMASWTTVGPVDARLTGFGALDGAVSRMISNSAPDMVNNSHDEINETVRAILMPAMNRFLNRHTMVTLVNLMADRNQNPQPRRCFHDTPRTCPPIF